MRWIPKPLPPAEQVEHLINTLGAPKVVAQLLCQRGIETVDKVKTFFNPKLTDLHDPFLMRDMDKAVERIQQAISKGEKVMIYGDYDVDGTTSVAMSYRFFAPRFKDCIYYIPDRYKEGYGISFAGIDRAEQEGVSLVIALDCGIRSVDKIEYASNKGIDFIICDHHLPGADLPQAVAVLDPKRTDCEYPYKELSGCGIGFKLIEAFAQVEDIAPAEYYVYLDLLALSIASDIVPIDGENRVLAYYGLKVINQQPQLGLKLLKRLAVKKEEMSIGDLVFYLGPRINAAGRTGSCQQSCRPTDF